MKPREYCCCAIPLVNAGIYATLFEQLLLGLVVGLVSVATPSIVGAATPSIAPWVLGVIAFVAAGVQLLGFLGVSGEKPILYRRYVTLHLLLTLAGFSVAAVWIAISASRHSTAKSLCLSKFFPNDAGGEGETMCEIFPWVDVGIMGALWILFGIMQTYLYFVISAYGSGQRQDHAQYNQINDPVNMDAIPMNNRGDPWDARPSTDLLRSGTKDYTHVRQDSELSVSDIMSIPVQKPKDSLSQEGYGYQEPHAAHDAYYKGASYGQSRPQGY